MQNSRPIIKSKIFGFSWPLLSWFDKSIDWQALRLTSFASNFLVEKEVNSGVVERTALLKPCNEPLSFQLVSASVAASHEFQDCLGVIGDGKCSLYLCLLDKQWTADRMNSKAAWRHLLVKVNCSRKSISHTDLHTENFVRASWSVSKSTSEWLQQDFPGALFLERLAHWPQPLWPKPRLRWWCVRML